MTPGISLIDKLYCLIMAEARMAILSRCICLESIRIQDGKTDTVEYLLDQIYAEDEKKNRLLPEPSEKYTTMFERVKKGQVGGGVGAADYTAPIEVKPLDRSVLHLRTRVRSRVKRTRRVK